MRPIEQYVLERSVNWMQLVRVSGLRQLPLSDVLQVNSRENVRNVFT
jgi:hypothetical protein